MTINLSIPKEEQDLKPRITVVGVGGAGGNAVNNMIRSNLIGCEFVVCNTDAQPMKQRVAEPGIIELHKFVYTRSIIANHNLYPVANERTTFGDALKMADDVLHSGV